MKTITPDLLKVAKIASKDTVRPILSGVLITPTHFVATDSYKILQVERTGLDASEFPKYANRDEQKIELREDDEIVLPAADLLKKQKFNRNSTLPILDEAIISEITRDKKEKIETVEITTTDLQVATKNVFRNLANENEFPDYKQIIPTGEPKARIIINPKMLIELLQQFDETVEIEIHDGIKPIVLREKGMLGCLMPLKDDVLPK